MAASEADELMDHIALPTVNVYRRGVLVSSTIRAADELRDVQDSMSDAAFVSRCGQRRPLPAYPVLSTVMLHSLTALVSVCVNAQCAGRRHREPVMGERWRNVKSTACGTGLQRSLPHCPARYWGEGCGYRGGDIGRETTQRAVGTPAVPKGLLSGSLDLISGGGGRRSSAAWPEKPRRCTILHHYVSGAALSQ